ncbi:MAG: N-formylglutamate amidohydrolase [Paracoccaceae bacterium]|jgi:predicted N-formylglutamate amidohydrolase
MPEYPAFEILNPNGKSPVLLLCDHASNAIPNCVNGGTLGLPAQDMQRHIAYDIGARGVTEHLTELLDAHAVVSRFSRLVVDPNRGEDDPTVLMKIYDGSIIPGNRNADNAEKERRLSLFYRPYHEALHRQIDMMIADGRTPALISVHSFTKQLKNREPRPWHLGVLWAEDERLAKPFMEYFTKDDDVCVGDNEPYSGELAGDTLYFHGTSRGLPHILIEVRNDLIETPEGQFEWADRIAPALWIALESLEKENEDG